MQEIIIMISLLCLNCNALHFNQICPNCQGMKHLVITLFEMPIQPEISRVIDQFEIVDANDTCAICFDHMDKGMKLPCNHIYHPECVKPWANEQANCPMCRQLIFRCKREQSGENGFIVNPHTIEALEELERVNKLYRKQLPHIF
eukprot:NODE_31_length_37178_cov_0.413576.p27 type:complete len:145 gc:universal NODE_31_length_37178_cov_0.413576:606-172(-)